MSIIFPIIAVIAVVICFGQHCIKVAKEHEDNMYRKDFINKYNRE
jgi:hypothetical protein